MSVNYELTEAARFIDFCNIAGVTGVTFSSRRAWLAVRSASWNKWINYHHHHHPPQPPPSSSQCSFSSTINIDGGSCLSMEILERCSFQQFCDLRLDLRLDLLYLRLDLWLAVQDLGLDSRQIISPSGSQVRVAIARKSMQVTLYNLGFKILIKYNFEILIAYKNFSFGTFNIVHETWHDLPIWICYLFWDSSFGTWDLTWDLGFWTWDLTWALGLDLRLDVRDLQTALPIIICFKTDNIIINSRVCIKATTVIDIR